MIAGALEAIYRHRSFMHPTLVEKFACVYNHCNLVFQVHFFSNLRLERMPLR